MRHNGAVRRLGFLLLLVLLLMSALGAVAAAASAPSGDRGSAGAVADTTTTTAGEEAAGTSPWVLVLIGAGAGAVIGVFTGLARRRRAQAGR